MIITYFCALSECSAACFFKKVNLKFIILTKEEYELLSLFFSFYSSSVSTLMAKDFKRKSNNNNIFPPLHMQES